MEKNKDMSNNNNEAEFLSEYLEQHFAKATSALRENNNKLQKEIIDMRLAKETAEFELKSKSEFLANMSHEIRTPMNNVLGMTGLLLDTCLDREQRELAEIIHNSSSSLVVVLNDILDLSKIEAGKLKFEHIYFDLWPLIEELSGIIAIKAKKKNIKFCYNINKDVPNAFFGDPARLRQILVNLLENAIKFTEKRGSVDINVSLDNKTDNKVIIRFIIIDSGIGIPKEQQGLLFKSYSQANAPATHKNLGTGLGLTISKRLTELMGGQIGFESNQGVGSEFWFTVELEKADDDFFIDKSYNSLSGMRILIVDDSNINREIITKYLKKWNCIFDEVTDTKCAFEKINRANSVGKPYCAVIINMQLSGIIGESFVKKIRKDPNSSNINFIMLTSYGEPCDSKWITKLGFASYITKPIKISQLYNSLLSVFKDKQNQVDKKLDDNLEINNFNSSPLKTKILLVEDNIVNRKLALRFIDKFGYKADGAINGKEAIKALEKNDYDIVLMDVQMPEQDGFSTAKIIRNPKSNVINHNIPIIAMTAHAMKGDREKCIDSGMNDYVPKPIDPTKLYEAIHKLIRN